MCVFLHSPLSNNNNFGGDTYEIQVYFSSQSHAYVVDHGSQLFRNHDIGNDFA